MPVCLPMGAVSLPLLEEPTSDLALALSWRGRDKEEDGEESRRLYVCIADIVFLVGVEETSVVLLGLRSFSARKPKAVSFFRPMYGSLDRSHSLGMLILERKKARQRERDVQGLSTGERAILLAGTEEESRRLFFFRVDSPGRRFSRSVVQAHGSLSVKI